MPGRKSISNFCGGPRGYGIRQIVKSAKLVRLSIAGYCGAPLPVSPVNSSNPAFGLSCLLVFSVFVSGRFSKVFNSVVRPVSVYMVNLVFAVFSMKNGPCHPMRPVAFIINSSMSIPVGINAGKSAFPSVSSIPSSKLVIGRKIFSRPKLPNQVAGFGVVLQARPQDRNRRQFFGFHVNPLWFVLTLSPALLAVNRGGA